MDYMNRIFINFIFVLLLPFFKIERLLFDISHGRRLKIISLYRLVMDSRCNPLSHIPDNNTRHLVMQVLAWMWCVVFSMWVGSILVFGVSAAIHAVLLAGIFSTWLTQSPQGVPKTPSLGEYTPAFAGPVRKVCAWVPSDLVAKD